MFQRLEKLLEIKIGSVGINFSIMCLIQMQNIFRTSCCFKACKSNLHDRYSVRCTCIRYNHSTCMYYNYSTCMYYDYGTCLYHNYSTCRKHAELTTYRPGQNLINFELEHVQNLTGIGQGQATPESHQFSIRK